MLFLARCRDDFSDAAAAVAAYATPCCLLPMPLHATPPLMLSRRCMPMLRDAIRRCRHAICSDSAITRLLRRADDDFSFTATLILLYATFRSA